ncbi:DNA mismatch repair protein MutS [Aureisphaera galaxeae]|uniref:Smr/MutS family protein n=1 Tax=Aureisphaera galaxeae TaxID=1538023 RepID=UPI002350F732|nr:Smr/MutS family protein [Aureisphaera galaxeae]MDC8004399.1 DNA mismatch repair protein MutS [Aureisphaera galaxeae]
MKIGDHVFVLDDTIAGMVTKIAGDDVTITTEDGFEMNFSRSELVVSQKNTPIDKNIDIDKISVIILEKEGQKRSKTKRIKPKERTLPAMEVDLHIHQLVKSSKGMSNYDMLSLQVDTAKRQLDFAISKRIQKVVFIHGVGEGVLRAELEYLFHRYDNIKYYDADFQKYGRGAIEVYVYQNKKP